MILTFKINSLETLAQVKQELNLLSKLENPGLEEISAIEINVSVGALSTNEFGEPSYEFTPEHAIELILHPSQDKITLTEKDLDKAFELMTILDDSIYEELKKLEDKAQGFAKRKMDVDWNKFEEVIDAAPSLDALYQKIKHDEEWSQNKKVALYKILSHAERILDIDTVYDFIDNFFEMRFCDLILKYPLKKEYTDRIISHPNMNPVVLDEFREKHAELDSVENILKTHDADIIEKYFFALVKRRGDRNINHEINALLKYPLTPSAVIQGMLFVYDICFIYEDVLPHPNCPVKLLEKYAIIPAYGVSVLKNIHAPGYLIDRMVDHFLAYDKEETFFNLVLNHPNTTSQTKERLNTKIKMLKDFYDNLSSKNLDIMVNSEKIKFNLNEIHDYAFALKKENKVNQDTLTIIDENMAEAVSKMNKILDINLLIKEYPQWDSDRTAIFVSSSLASEEVCKTIMEKELTNSHINLVDSTPMITEISKKYTNLIQVDFRKTIIKKLKDQAISPKEGNDVANQVINNVHYINNSFTLTPTEKHELIEALLENQAVDIHLKEQLNKVS